MSTEEDGVWLSKAGVSQVENGEVVGKSTFWSSLDGGRKKKVARRQLKPVLESHSSDSDNEDDVDLSEPDAVSDNEEDSASSSPEAHSSISRVPITRKNPSILKQRVEAATQKAKILAQNKMAGKRPSQVYRSTESPPADSLETTPNSPIRKQPKKNRRRVLSDSESDDNDECEILGAKLDEATIEFHKESTTKLKRMFPTLSTKRCRAILVDCKWAYEFAVGEAMNFIERNTPSKVSADNIPVEKVIELVDLNCDDSDDSSGVDSVIDSIANNGVSGDQPSTFANSKGFRESVPSTVAVRFFNTATIDELMSIPRCSKSAAEIIITLRPFSRFNKLKIKFRNTKGISESVADYYLELMEAQGDLECLLTSCVQISDQIRSSISALNQSCADQCPLLNKDMSLKAHQKIGVNWLKVLRTNGVSAILADEMGLGKTIQIIAFLADLKHRGCSATHLIVVPSSTMDNWLAELVKWCPALEVMPYYGDLATRQMYRSETKRNIRGFGNMPDIILTTYNMVTSTKYDRGFFRSLEHVEYIIFDEAHMLKNCATARFRQLVEIPAKFRILLTGTPLQNDLVELMSLLYFLVPNFFEQNDVDLECCLKMFTNAKGRLADYAQEQIQRAKLIMNPFVLRRLKVDVLGDLPNKYHEMIHCEMHECQAAMYSTTVEEFKTKVRTDGSAIKGKSGVSFFMDLRKISNHPLLLRRLYTREKLWEMAKLMLEEPTHLDANENLIFDDMEIMNDYELHRLCLMYNKVSKYALPKESFLTSGKLDALDKLLPDIIDKKSSKVLIFSQFTMVLDILEKYLQIRKRKFMRLDGSTPVVERQGMINDFNSGNGISIFLLSTRAGGLGINLTSANYIIFHDLDFNPYNDKQAEDRCHRMGQTKDVYVIRLLSNSSVENSIQKHAEAKLLLEKRVTSKDDLSDQEVAKMLATVLNLNEDDVQSAS